MNSEFNDFRFCGLGWRQYSNKYITMKRTNPEDTKIIVKVASDQVLRTKYGFALIIDDKHVVFLKNWHVNVNNYGTEVLLDKDYFIIKEWGDFPEYANNEQNFDWETWVKVAKEQDALTDDDGSKLNPVRWKN